jgi:phosphatidate cytidylyltransferase
MPDDRLSKPSGPGASTLAAAAARNLQQRVTSGLVMVLVALALVYAGVVPFALLVLAVGMLMSWEWGHLVRGVAVDSAICVHAVAVAIAIGLVSTGYPLLALLALVAGGIVVASLTIHERCFLSTAGVLYVGLPAVAMVWLRANEPHGFAAVIFLFLVVWTTDTMAFAVGRAMGGPKLWPAISPNKTWAGFFGGIVSSAMLSALFAQVVPGAHSWRLGLIGLVMGVIAQGGDLFESALKRAFGVKDASHLIPGHGGVMDRMDGIVAVVVAAALLSLAFDAYAPATFLLIGR